MGTSTGYKMPTGGEWTPLKNEATRFVGGGGNDNTPQNLLSNYAQALENSPGFVGSGSGGGTGGGGRQGSVNLGASGGAARRVGQAIGNFLSRVGTSGLTQALRDIGLGDLAGKSASQIVSALVDKLVGPASTIDDQEARLACDDLRKELLSEAKTAEDVQAALKTNLDAKGLGGLLMLYFGFYIFRCFQRDFYEAWLKKVEPVKASAQLAKVEKYVKTRLASKMVNKDISAFNWGGKPGEELIERILRDTCRVFRIGPQEGEGQT